MRTAELQKGIWQWFALDPANSRSFTAVNKMCTQLYSQYRPDQPGKNARYHLLYPLLRYGIIEFYGDNRLALSPTAILEGDHGVLFLNVPGVESALVKETQFFSLTGLSGYPKSSAVRSFIKETGIPLSTFCLRESLGCFPNLDTVVKEWPEIPLLDHERCYHFNESNSWQLVIPGKKGIYKRSAEPYVQKMLLFGPDQWKVVPKPEQHIDAFSIAWLWSKLQNGQTMEVTYLPKTQLLTVHTPFFPLLIERLLFVHTLLNRKDLIDPLMRQYFITPDEFKILNHLFLNRITVI